MGDPQRGILDAVPAAARYLSFRLRPEAQPGPVLQRLAAFVDGHQIVLGLGAQTLSALGKLGHVPGMREAEALIGPGVAFPSTPLALWAWLRGTDRGELLQRGRKLVQLVSDAFVLDSVTDAFFHDSGRDLTGYEDGTENPKEEAAIAAAVVQGQGAGLDGGSFVAVQIWRHDLNHFETLSPLERDHVVGRRREDNEEIEDAPDSAHVKRTAQEDFDPPAFVVRRSMPWAGALDEGLVFVAFGHSFDAFEALSRRMLGLEDGLVDALFRFTRPLTSSYFWCPPVKAGKLQLSALGL
ncbi:MAG TPA: Dyp-type peroxidase [Polyangiales bacterium]